MSKHKTEDYKLIAVKYYLENNVSYAKTCEIFKERPKYLSRSKVISGTSSVGKLQCHSTSIVEATQSKFTRPETGKPFRKSENRRFKSSRV